MTRIVYQDIAVNADEDAAVTSTAAQSFADPALVPFGGAEGEYITGEPNVWVLDGTGVPLENDTPVAVWSLERSDENGDFASPPTLTFSFDNTYTLLGVTLVFGAGPDEIADHIRLTFYRGSTVLLQKEHFPNAVQFFAPGTVKVFDRITLEFLHTKQPLRYAKLAKFFFGVKREFEAGELERANVTCEISPISDVVAINTLDFVLRSSSDTSYIFQQKQPMSAYDRDKLLGVFYVDTAPQTGAHSYEVHAEDAIGVLDKSDFPGGVYTSKNAKELVLEILDGDFALDFPASLESKTVTGAIETCSRREALQQVAFALTACVDTSGTETVRFFILPTDTKPVPANRTYTSGTVGTEDIVTSVQLTAHTYTQGTPSSGQGRVTINGVEYIHTETVTEVFNPLINSGEKRNVKKFTRATLVNPGNVDEVAAHLMDYYKNRRVYSGKIKLEGELPGDLLEIPTTWGQTLTGRVSRMDITLSGIAAANVEARGEMGG